MFLELVLTFKERSDIQRLVNAFYEQFTSKGLAKYLFDTEKRHLLLVHNVGYTVMNPYNVAVFFWDEGSFVGVHSLQRQMSSLRSTPIRRRPRTINGDHGADTENEKVSTLGANLVHIAWLMLSRSMDQLPDRFTHLLV
jgi:hypothetical protein